jgi:hypothetical protein
MYTPYNRTYYSMELIYAVSKVYLNLQLLQEKREIKRRRESCFQTLYTTPGWSTHPIILREAYSNGDAVFASS